MPLGLIQAPLDPLCPSSMKLVLLLVWVVAVSSRVDVLSLSVESMLEQESVRLNKMFPIPYCDVLRQVWQQVPIVWKPGLSVVRAVPRGHRCKSEVTALGAESGWAILPKAQAGA